MKPFSERLREVRKHAGLDQQQLADLLGVSRFTVTNWERGKTEPPVHAPMTQSDILARVIRMLR